MKSYVTFLTRIFCLLAFVTGIQAQFRQVDFLLSSSEVAVESHLQQEGLTSKIEILWAFEDNQWKVWFPASRSDLTTNLAQYERIDALRLGQGYLAFMKGSSSIPVQGKTVAPNSVRLTTTLHSLVSFNLTQSIAVSELLTAANLSTGKVDDIAEVWQYNPASNSWKFYSPNKNHPNRNQYDLLSNLSPGTSLWIRSKVAGLEIRLNNQAPVFSISGTSSLVPPSAANPSPRKLKISPSLHSIGVSAASSVASLCKYDGSDTKSIGKASLYTINGEKISQVDVFCPSDPGEKIQYSLGIPAEFKRKIQESPALGENLVVKVRLISGQEEKGIILQDLKDQITGETSQPFSFDTNSKTTLLSMVTELELAKKAGVAPDQLSLASDGNSDDDVETIDLSQFFLDDEEPLDMVRFGELVDQLAPEEAFDGEPQNFVQSLVKTINDLNDPGVEATVRQSAKKLFTTTPQAENKTMQKLLSKTVSLIGANVKASQESILSGTTNPVEICAQKLLEVDPSILATNATNNLLNACNLVEQNVKLAISVNGDANAKAAVLDNIRELAENFDSSALSRIATQDTPFEFLNLTAKLVSFPKNLVDLLEENQDASDALASLLGQSTELLAEAKAIDSQAQLQNDTRKLEILAAIKALESENEKLGKVLTIAKDPQEVVRRMADYIVNGGDPAKLNEVSELLGDKFADGTELDYAALIDQVRAEAPNPVEIITDLIKSSSDSLIAMKVFAESVSILSKEQIDSIINDKEIKDNFALNRNIIAIAGRSRDIQVEGAQYNLKLDGSRSFDPQGEEELTYLWQEVTALRGDVVTTLQGPGPSAKATVLVTHAIGTRYYRLTITNADGSKSSEDEIRIKFFRYPTPFVGIEPAFQAVQPGNVTTFSVAWSFYPEAGDIDSFSIEQIAGPSSLPTLNGTLYSFTPTTPGLYEYIVSATKNVGTTSVVGTRKVAVRVKAQFPPMVDAGPSTQMKVGESLQLENFTFSPNEAALTFAWEPESFLTDATVQEPTFTPTVPGVYDLTLNVTDEFGGAGSDTVRIEVLESYAPITVTSESIVLDFREIAEDSVTVVLEGCGSYSVENLPLTYEWSSTTFIDDINNPTNCSASAVFNKEDFVDKTTHHFYLKVDDGAGEAEGTFSVRVLPATSLPPEIILEYFPEKTAYLAGEDLDIESWQSFSYNDKPLLFTWTPLDADSKNISRTLRSRFQGIQRDTLELSIPDQLGTTATASKQYSYQFTVTEKNADNSLGLQSSKLVKINAYQVCPKSPIISSLEMSREWFRVSTGVKVLELQADYAARCLNSDGTPHETTISWDYDSALFTPDTTAVSDSLILSFTLEDFNDAPTEKEFTFTVNDLVNGTSTQQVVSVDIYPEVSCELDIDIPGQESDEDTGIYSLVPEKNYVMTATMNCSDQLNDDELIAATTGPQVFERLHMFPVTLSDSGEVLSSGALQLVTEELRANSLPEISITTQVRFTETGSFGFIASNEAMSAFEKGMQPIFANIQYLKMKLAPTIVSRTNNFGEKIIVNSDSYEEKTTASVLSFRMDASRSSNPNTTGGPISYDWSIVGDSQYMSFTSSGPLAMATVSGMPAFAIQSYTVRVTLSDASGKATTVTSDLTFLLEQDNSLPVITNVQVPGRLIYNDVSVTYDLFDLEGEHSSIAFEFSTDGSNWLTAEYVESRTEPITDTSPGILRGLYWSAHRSLAASSYTSTQIRLTPTDPYGREGAQAFSEIFELNVPQSPVVTAVIVDRICRETDGNSIISVESDSYEGGCVTETIDFHLAGSAEDHPYKDTFRYSWASNSITSYWFIPQIEKQNANWTFGEDAEEEDSRMSLSSEEYEGQLYFWGGTQLQGKEVFNTVLVYDPENEEWSTGADGGSGRRLHSGVLRNGKIYHYGGRLAAFEAELDPPAELDGFMDVYDITSDSWSTMTVTSLEVGFRHDLGVLHDDKIYHFGAWTRVPRGTRNNSHYDPRMYIFDFSSDSWSVLDTPGAPDANTLEPMTADLHDGKIYYSGGQASGKYRRVYIYDIASNSWSKSDPAEAVPWKDSFESFSTFNSQTVTSYQVDKSNPEEYWEASTGKTISIAPAMNRTESLVYVSGDRFFALNEADGSEHCTFSSNGKGRFAAPAVGPDETIHVTVGGDKALYVLDQNCNLKWRTDDTTDFQSRQTEEYSDTRITHMRRPAIGADRTIYAPSGKYLLAMNHNGQIQWRFKADGTVSRPVIGGDGVVYFGTSGKNVYAVNPDGTKKWSAIVGEPVPRVASINKKEIIFFKGNKQLHAFDKDGKKLGTAPRLIKKAPYTAFHDEDNTVYITDGKYLYAFNPDLSQKWRVPDRKLGWPSKLLRGGFRDNPVVGRDGLIYIGSNDSHMYAIDRDGRPVWRFKATHKVASFAKLTSKGRLLFIDQNKKIFGMKVPSKGMADSSWPTFQGDNQNSGRFYVRSADPAVPAPEPPPTPPDPDAPGQAKWFFEGCQSNDFHANPALGDDGTLYINCNYPTFKFFAINPDGSEKWSHSYAEEGQFPHITAGTVHPDGGDVLYAVSGVCGQSKDFECERGKLVRADEEGNIVWATDIKVGVPSSPAIGPDGTIYLNTWTMRLFENSDTGFTYAFNADGEQVWSVDTKGAVLPPAVGKDGTVYVANYVDDFLSQSQTREGQTALYAIYPEGDLKWKYETVDNIRTAPAIAPNGDVVVAVGKEILSITEEGEPRWRYRGIVSKDKVQRKLSMAIDGRGQVYVPINKSPNSTLLVLNSEGKKVWTTQFKGFTTLSSPVIGTNGLKFIGAGTFGKGVYYSINSSRELTPTTFITDSPSTGAAAVSTDGTVYFGTVADGKIWAVTSHSKGVSRYGWARFKHDNKNTAAFGAYDNDFGRGGGFRPTPPPDTNDPDETDPNDGTDPGDGSNPGDGTDPGDGLDPIDGENPGETPSNPNPEQPSQPGAGGTTEPIEIVEPPAAPPSTGFPNYRKYHASVMWKGKIFFYGGDVGFANGYQTSYTNSVDIYDIKNNRWEWGVAAPVGRSHHTGAIIGNTFYFYGGTNGEAAKETVEIYNPSSIKESLLYRVVNTYEQLTHQVTYKASMGIEVTPATRKITDHATALYGDKLFVLGGQDATEITNQVSVYKVSGAAVETTTYEFPTLFFSRKNHSASVWGSKLFVLGGENAQGRSKMVEVYQLQTDRAERLNTYKIPNFPAISGHQSAVFENTLFVFGGRTNDGVSNAIHAWSLETDEAKYIGTVANLQTAREDFALSQIRGEVYLFGGSDGNDALKSIEGFKAHTTGLVAIDSGLLPELPSALSNATAVSNQDKVMLIGGKYGSEGSSSGTTQTTGVAASGSHSSKNYIYQHFTSPVLGKVLHPHPSYGVAELSMGREGLSAQIARDLLILVGGKASDYPSLTFEVQKLTGNNAQSALASAEGSAQVSFTLQRLKPTATISQPVVTGTSGDLLITFDLADETGIPANLSMEVSEDDGVTWGPATPIEGVGIDLTVVATGVGLQLTWDTSVMYPGNYRDFRIRLIATDGSKSPASDLFDIINQPAYLAQLPVVSSLTIASGDRGEIDFSYNLSDPNGETVDVEVFYFNGLELQSIEVLDDIAPGDGKSYTWDSSEYESTFLTGTYLLMMPTDSVTGEEGTSDQTELFNLMNGVINTGDIVVTGTCGGSTMNPEEDLYTCAGGNAVFTLDASGTVNENQGEALVFGWSLPETSEGVLQNTSSSIATLLVTDDGIVTSSNVVRALAVEFAVHQEGNPQKSEEQDLEFQLAKPAVQGIAHIVSYDCGGSTSAVPGTTSYLKAFCTQPNMQVVVDATASSNPNPGGIQFDYDSDGAFALVTSSGGLMTFDITLPTAYEQLVLKVLPSDSPNGVTSDEVELTFEVKQKDDNQPEFGDWTVTVNEQTGLVTASVSVTDVGNGLVSPDVTNAFARKSVANFTPTTGTIQGLSQSYQTPTSIMFTWDSKQDVPTCETGVQVGLNLTDEEGHVSSSQSDPFELWNCGKSGIVTGTIALRPTTATGVQGQSFSTQSTGGLPNITTCVYDGAGNLISEGRLGHMELLSLGGDALATGVIWCSTSPTGYPTYTIPLGLELRTQAEENPHFFKKLILEANFNSGQFMSGIDVNDRDTNVTNATPDSIASWNVDLDEKDTYFYFYVETLADQKFKEQQMFPELKENKGTIDLVTLNTYFSRAYSSSDAFYITTRGFINRTLNMMTDSGRNTPKPTQPMEPLLNKFFDLEEPLDFQVSEQQKLIDSYSTLNDLIVERAALSSSSPLTSVLDAMIAKLFKIGVPGTDGVENDPKSQDPGALCNPEYFSLTIADLLEKTIAISHATQGSAFEFESAGKLDQIITDLRDPALLNPQNCSEAETTLTRLLAESLEVSDEYMAALAKNTKAAKDMAGIIGEANAALAAKNAQAKSELSTDLAEIAELDNYLKKLESANDKLKELARNSVDNESLADILAESLRQSAKFTGGTVALIGLIKGLETELGANPDSSFDINLGEIVGKATDNSEVNKIDFISDILEQQENLDAAAEIFDEVAKDMTREQVEFIADNKFSDRPVIYVSIGEGEEFDLEQSDSETISLDASEFYDPSDKEGEDDYTFTWTVTHENPNIPPVSVVTTTASTSFTFEKIDVELEENVFELALDRPEGTQRIISIQVRNTNTGNESKVISNRYVFYGETVPVADAGRYQEVVQGQPFTLDASDSYTLNPGDLDQMIFYWKCISYPQTDPPIQGSSVDITAELTPIVEFNAPVPGLYTFQVTAYNGSKINGLYDEATVQKFSYAQPPLAADAGADALIPTSTPLKLTNGSYAPDMSGLTFLWSPSENLDNPTTAEPTFTASSQGEYELTLQVTDTHGQTKSDTVVITVQNMRKPFASSGQIQNIQLTEGQAPFDIQLNASESFSYAGENLSYSWSGTTYLTNSALTVTNPTSAVATFTIDPALYAQEGQLRFTVEVTDTTGTSKSTVAVRILPPVKTPIVIIKKDPIRNLYRATESFKLILADSYSRNGKFLNFSYTQLEGPEVTSITPLPTGAHVEYMDSAEILLPDFEEDLVQFKFLVSVHDLSSTTAYLEITTSTQEVVINAVPLLRKPVIRSVPDVVEVRLTDGVQPTVTIDGSDSRTLDHDGNDLRNPMAFNWMLDTGVLSVQDSSASSSALKFKVNTSAPEIVSIGKNYTTTVELMVTDTENNKTATKDVTVIIYPKFNPVEMEFQYLVEHSPSGFDYPFYDTLSERWIYLSQTATDQLSFTASFDNSLNENHPDLLNSFLYGPVRISVKKDQQATTIIDTLHPIPTSMGVTKANTAGLVHLDGNGNYKVIMEAGIQNGMRFSNTYTLFATDTWVPLQVNPILVKSTLDSSKTSQLNVVPAGQLIELEGAQAVVELNLQGVNPNGGTLNYADSVVGGSYAVSLTDKGSGVYDIGFTVPEEISTIQLSFSASDSLNRPSIPQVVAPVNFQVRKYHSAPRIELITSSISFAQDQYLEIKYNLYDTDKDFNDIALHYSVDGTNYLTAVSLEGETRVKEGNNYTVRWYYKRDGSLYIDNRKQISFKLHADDNSYQPPADSLTHTKDFIVEESWSDYTGGILSVEGVSELNGSSFVEIEGSSIFWDREPLARGSAGDSFSLKGAIDHPSDIRDSMRIEVVGPAYLDLTWLDKPGTAHPEIGVFDVEARKFIAFDWKRQDSMKGILLNPMGGIHKYDVVVFHQQMDIDTYEILVDLSPLDYDKVHTTLEREPNNHAKDGQYLGTLSRMLDYEVRGSLNDKDFFEFSVYGEFPLGLQLFALDNYSGQRLKATVWNLETNQQVARFEGTQALRSNLHLSRGRYALEIEGAVACDYLLKIHESFPTASDPDLGPDLLAQLETPNRKVPLNVNYFEGLYLGEYSEIVEGELTYFAKAELSGSSPSNVSKSLQKLSGFSSMQSPIQAIHLSVPKPVSSRSGASSRGEDMRDRYHTLFYTIEALEDYKARFGEERVDSTHYLYPTAVKPDDTKYAQGQMWDIDAINLPEAWEISKGSKDVIVAVIDTGVALHDDLGTSLSDPTGNLIAGWDFIDNDDDPFVTSGNVHGGHVAGTIGAKANNAKGIVGMNWDVKIMNLRVCATRSCNGNAIYNAILYAAGLPNSSGRVPDVKADVMNMSLGGPGQSDAYRQAMSNALDAGTLPVCAAGNDSRDMTQTFYSPGGYDECLCVSAIAKNLQIASFSNYGANIVDIGAPGTEIWSTVHNNGYDSWQGTSMAAPHVAGVAALVKSVNPNLTPAEVRAFLEEYSTDLGSPGRDAQFGHGFLNAFASVNAAADDAGLFGPKLGTVPSSVQIVEGVNYQQLTVVNKGSDNIDNLSYSVQYTTAVSYEYIYVRPSAKFGSVPSRVGVYVDKYHLPVGSYDAVITFNGRHVESGDSVEALTVPISITVGANEEKRPLILVQALQNGVVVAQTYSNYNEGYHYALDGLAEGATIEIQAGTDLDRDGEICDAGERWCGKLGGFGQPSQVQIVNGSYRGDLRFDVTRFNQGFYPVPTLSDLSVIGVRSDIQVRYDLDSSFTANVIMEYKLEGTSEYVTIPSTHLNGNVTGNHRNNELVLWSSNLTLPGHIGNVELRLRTVLADNTPGNSQASIIAMDNNNPPVVTNVTVSGQTRDVGLSALEGDISIIMDVSEPDGDPVSLTVQWSRNASFNYADVISISGQLDTVSPGQVKLVWHSQFDIVNRSENTVFLKVLATDGKVQLLPFDISDAFSIDNTERTQGQWRETNAARGGCTLPGRAVWNDRAYFFCGAVEGSFRDASNEIVIFDILNPENEIASDSLQVARAGHAAIQVDNMVYVYGGRANNVVFDSLESYNLDTGEKVNHTASGEPRSHHVGWHHDGRLYFWSGLGAGGFTGLNTMSIYDIASDTWSEGITGGRARFYASASKVGSKVYIVGGSGSNNILDVFNLDTQSFEQGQTIAGLNFEGHSANAVAGSLYFIGGLSSGITNDSVTILDLDDMSTQEELVSGTGALRREHNAVVYNNRIYTWGGRTHGTQNPNPGNLQSYVPKSLLKTLVSFQRQNSSIIEGNWDLEITVALNKEVPEGETVTVNYTVEAVSATADTDFALSSGSLSFAAGERLKGIAFTVSDDQEQEGNESFKVTITEATGAGLGEIQVYQFNIIDDEGQE